MTIENTDVEDPLKSLEDICVPDSRHSSFSIALEDIHRVLSEITLHSRVPMDVRQLFETAKNVSLYSWYVYRFHQVAELVGYSALEMALKERYRIENPDKKSPTLRGLLKYAQSERWITNEGFSDRLSRARRYAETEKTFEAIEQMKETGESERMVDDPTEEEILNALEKIDIVGGIVSSTANLRNDLAHGSKTLHPQSISTLRTISEVINQVF